MSASSLRRRGQLAPLEPPTTVEGVEDNLLEPESSSTGSGSGSSSSNNDNVFNHYVSPCEFRVSNDPLLVSETDVCDATIYGCVRDHTFLLSSNDEVKEIALQYDYDLYYDGEFNTANGMLNFQEMVEFLEGTMLEHLASLLDVKQCPSLSSTSAMARLGGPPTRRRTAARMLQGFSDEQKSVVIAINSMPGDRKSTEYECMSPPAEDDGTMCQSMEGLMTVYVESARVSDADQVIMEEALFSAIGAGMESNTYAKGTIQGLTFIGSRATPAPTTTTPTTATVVTEAPGTPGTPDEPVLEPGTTTPPPVVTSGNQVVAVSKGEPVDNGGSIGGTQIGLISAASAFLIVAALVGLLLSKRRRRVETLDEDDSALDGSRSVPSLKGSPVRVTPRAMLVKQWSLEGSEIPGSLASQDAMALKPQFKRCDDNSYVNSDSERSAPRTPPRLHNVALQSSSSSQEVTLDAGVLLPAVPLSPVRNSRSGLSPSRVSPKRLPASLNAPFVSARRSSNRIDRRADSFSVIDKLVAEIDADTGSPARSGRNRNTIETLQRIAYTGSGSTASFQDTESGESRQLGHSVNL